MNHEVTRVINTGYGPLEVPVDLLNLWNRYGWPNEEALRGMVKAGTVYSDGRAAAEDREAT